MTSSPQQLVDAGLEVTDVRFDTAFAARSIHRRDAEVQMTGMRRLVRAVLSRPQSVLQELVDIAVELCGAESAGISIERPGAADGKYYHWIATAGVYSRFMDAILPRYPSACGVCLERGAPQHFRVGQRFFDILGIQAPLVTDGILLPWETDGVRGTIFVMAHQRHEAFDLGDCRLMELLADFAVLAIRQHRHQNTFLQEARKSAAAAMSNSRPHRTGNPLKSLIHLLYLDEGGVRSTRDRDPQAYEPAPGDELQSLSTLVTKLLSVPYPGQKPR